MSVKNVSGGTSIWNMGAVAHRRSLAGLVKGNYGQRFEARSPRKLKHFPVFNRYFGIMWQKMYLITIEYVINENCRLHVYTYKHKQIEPVLRESQDVSSFLASSYRVWLEKVCAINGILKPTTSRLVRDISSLSRESCCTVEPGLSCMDVTGWSRHCRCPWT